MPASDGGDDFVGIGDPLKGFEWAFAQGAMAIRAAVSPNSILEYAAAEQCARFGGSDCRFWSLSGKTRIFPIADEAAGEHAGKSAAFADKMGLIEIPKFMDNIGP